MHCIVLDRHSGSATAWPMAIDDLDVGQDFPAPLTFFESGEEPTGYKRQKLMSPDLLTHHDLPITDSFVLLLKANALYVLPFPNNTICALSSFLPYLQALAHIKLQYPAPHAHRGHGLCSRPSHCPGIQDARFADRSVPVECPSGV